MDPVALSVFASRVASVCDEMGAVLRRTAFSPNIRDRLDYSCALFDAHGRLVAQAANIPVHLGSMAYAMQQVVTGHTLDDGDVLVFNDPFLGGTHLPDVTLVAPVHVDGVCVGYAANRAHHADIGAVTPGSMPLSSRLEEEGVRIPPRKLRDRGVPCEAVLREITGATRNPEQAAGDFAAQASSVALGVERLAARVRGRGRGDYVGSVDALNANARRLVEERLRRLPAGTYRFTDVLDDDGQGTTDIPIHVAITVADGRVLADFTGTADQVPGNVNCPMPVTAAATHYVFRCLMPPQTPACAGAFAPIELHAPAGSLVNAREPAAVAAGNVETSQRIVDVVSGALGQAAPEHAAAASQGTMNNLAMGAAEGAHSGAWDYYETLAGGAGAGPAGAGRSAVHTHMTNTLNTPIEALEMAYPLRVTRYAVRRGSGGEGVHPGGEGVARCYRILDATEATWITERRRHAPWGLAGGGAGAPGAVLLNGVAMPGKERRLLRAGDTLEVLTPGGGAWGEAALAPEDHQQ